MQLGGGRGAALPRGGVALSQAHNYHKGGQHILPSHALKLTHQDTTFDYKSIWVLWRVAPKAKVEAKNHDLQESSFATIGITKCV